MAKSAKPSSSRGASGKAAGTRSQGGSISNAYRDTIVPGIDRANVMFLLPSDSRNYLNGWTRYRVNQKIEWLHQNFPIVGELGSGIARHTVGKGIGLVIDSEDHDWAMAAEEDFADYANTPDRCDIAGRRDFYDMQTFAVEQFAVFRGEFFASHVKNPRWENAPAVQIWDSNEIESPSKTPDGVIDGVQVDTFARPLNYFSGDKGRPIAARDMVHWYKPHMAHQVRAVSPLASAVNNLVDIHELKRLTTRTAKAQQLIALVLKGISKKKTRGAMGALARAPVGSADSDINAKSAAQLEQLYGGAGAGIAYLDETGDAKLLSTGAPSPLVEPFIDLLMRDACLAPGVPMEFFWNLSKLGGAPLRLMNSKADLFFTVTSDGLTSRFCTPVAYRYLQHRIAIGRLKKPKATWRITWQYPARVTADTGHDTDANMALLANGAATLREIYGNRGEHWLPHTRQWVREALTFLKIAKAEGASPELIARWEQNLPLWRASAPGTHNASEGGQPQKKEKPGQKKGKQQDDPADNPPGE